MSEKKLKYSVGMFLVFSNLAIIFVIVVLRFLGGFDKEQFTTVLAITIPMFSGYSTSIIAFIISDRHIKEDKSASVTFSYSMLSFIFPIIFTMIILSSIVLQSYSKVFVDFADFKSFLITVDSIFASYIGYFIYSMFKMSKRSVK